MPARRAACGSCMREPGGLRLRLVAATEGCEPLVARSADRGEPVAPTLLGENDTCCPSGGTGAVSLALPVRQLDRSRVDLRHPIRRCAARLSPARDHGAARLDGDAERVARPRGRVAVDAG